MLKGTLLYSRRVDEEKNVTAEHINLSLVEFELFCGEKGWRKGEEEEKKKWANFLLLVFNARRREAAAAAQLLLLLNSFKMHKLEQLLLY